MRTFFKDNDKIVINSMDSSEALVGKTFLDKLDETKKVCIEARNDINDDFDGLVISIKDADVPEKIPFKDIEVDNSIKYEVLLDEAVKNKISINLRNEAGILCEVNEAKVNHLLDFILDSYSDDELTMTFDLSEGTIDIFPSKDAPSFTYVLPEGTFIYYDKETVCNPETTITFPEFKYIPEAPVDPDEPEYPTNEVIKIHGEIITNDGTSFEMRIVPDKGKLVDFKEQFIEGALTNIKGLGYEDAHYDEETNSIKATTTAEVDTYFHFSQDTFKLVIHEDDILYKSGVYAIHVYGTTIDDETPGVEPPHEHLWDTTEVVDEDNKKIKQVCTTCGEEQWIDYIPKPEEITPPTDDTIKDNNNQEGIDTNNPFDSTEEAPENE